MIAHLGCIHDPDSGCDQDWQRRLFAAKRPAPVPAAPEGRKKLWDLMPGLHCSVIGTCLDTPELRALYEKLGRPALADFSDHELHTLAVDQAGRKGEESRALHRLLERRHEAVIRRFERASDAQALAGLWEQAYCAGEVPGAYWALLTHRKCNDTLMRKAFGDVHMLSHLVGSSHRADLGRRLELEHQLADARAAGERQQAQIARLITERDHAVRSAAEHEQDAAHWRRRAAEVSGHEAELASLRAECGRLADRLAREQARAQSALVELEAARRALAERTREAEYTAEQVRAARQERDNAVPATAPAHPDWPALHGLRVLYVGGRAGQVHEFRTLIEAAGGELLSHDGGLEERHGLLAPLVSRSDAVLFPVECVSHEAVAALKRLCRKSGRRYLPLRNASMATLRQALSSLVATPSETEAA